MARPRNSGELNCPQLQVTRNPCCSYSLSRKSKSMKTKTCPSCYHNKNVPLGGVCDVCGRKKPKTRAKKPPSEARTPSVDIRVIPVDDWERESAEIYTPTPLHYPTLAEREELIPWRAEEKSWAHILSVMPVNKWVMYFIERYCQCQESHLLGGRCIHGFGHPGNHQNYLRKWSE